MKKSIINNTVISHQNLSLPVINGDTFTNKSLLLSHSTSVIFKSNLLTFTLLANKSGSEAYYFNTSMFSNEAAYSYTLFKSLRMSSGTGYYANQGWNRQVGINQQVSAELLKKLSIDFQAGYKKAVKTFRPELANQLYLNTSVHYNF